MEAATAISDPSASALLERAFSEHRRFLWNLVYRLTGNAADADDIVQETFIRALSRPPADQDRNLCPWLVQVALNLGRDLLRRRRRTGYVGTWLPSPVETEPPSHEPADESGNPSARYDMIESVSFAFLLALEALSPMQRAVLILRDVFDYSSAEAAEALEVSEANARQLHSRARRALAAYDATRRSITVERQEKTRLALERFVNCLVAGDTQAMQSLLAADVKVMSDGGAEFTANRVPVVGVSKVMALFFGLAKKSPPATRVEFRIMNGLPALIVERPAHGGFAPRFVLQADIDDDGKLANFYSVLSTRKLSAIQGG